MPGWIKKAVEELRPRPRLPVSQWAEENRVLPSTNAIPGPWRNSVTPYLTEIMDTFFDGDAEKIILVKPAQVGGTSAMENILGCLICQDPGPAMVVYPSDELGERTVEAKLEPMIKSTPALAELYLEQDSKKLRLKFRDMTVLAELCGCGYERASSQGGGPRHEAGRGCFDGGASVPL